MYGISRRQGNERTKEKAKRRIAETEREDAVRQEEDSIFGQSEKVKVNHILGIYQSFIIGRQFLQLPYSIIFYCPSLLSLDYPMIKRNDIHEDFDHTHTFVHLACSSYSYSSFDK